MRVASTLLMGMLCTGVVFAEDSVDPAQSGPKAAASTEKSAAEGVKTSRTRDRLDLDTTTITGNRELPKVMYVVPWKRADLGDLAGRPVNSLLDEALAPVDRDVFRRQLHYFEEIDPDRPDRAEPPAGTEPEH